MTVAHRLPRSTPEAQGVSSSALLSFVRALDDLGGAHSVVVLRHGHVVAEGWWAPYAPELPHELYSLSKSFTSTAVGLAVAESLLGLDDLVVDLLPDSLPPAVGEQLAAMRLRDLLTMTTGHDEDSLGPGATAGSDWARAVLAQPVPHRPGTRFVYDSGATHLVAAALQRVTGQRLLDYLTPRLFGPLGVERPRWTQSPDGVDAGGWGLSLTTEDVAAFGQLLLDRGARRGEQLVPRDWVAAATSAQVPNDHRGVDPDWEQGYGYQFWRCRHGAYRGDGAFGQFCVVLPDQDAVVVMTSGTTDLQAPLDALWEHLLPALASAAALDEDPAVRAELASTLRDLQRPVPAGSASSPAAARLAGRRWVLPENDVGLVSVRLEPGDGVALTLGWAGVDVHLDAGHGAWTSGEVVGVPGWSGPVAAAAAWADDVLTVHLQLVETPFALHLALRSEGDDALAVRVVRDVWWDTPVPLDLVAHPEP